jgi:hypothetical protein
MLSAHLERAAFYETHPRGAWGSPGDFSFAHCIEDAEAALTWLHQPVNAARLEAEGLAPLAITSDDGLTIEVAGLIARLREGGNTRAREIHIATDHAYSDRRIALTETVLTELDRIGQ